MSIRVLCPEGHPVCVHANKLGGTVICPRCYTCFLAELADLAGSSSHHAREKPQSKRSRDDDEDDEEVKKKPKAKKDDEEEEEEKQVKKKPKAKKDDEETGIQEKPSAKAKSASAKKSRNDDDDDEDDEEEEEEKPRKKKPKAKRDDDDEDDEDDDEKKDEPEEEPIEWTKKKRQLNIVNVGMMAYLIGFYTMIVLFIILVIFELPSTLFLVIALWSENYDMASFFCYCLCVIAAIGAFPIYICHLIGWITGIMSPAKAEGRGTCITAILMFVSPIFLLVVYLIFDTAIISRDAVAARMFQMFLFFGFVLMMMAFYCSLIYIGSIAGYLGMTTEKRKPQALGWFIVGGSI